MIDDDVLSDFRWEGDTDDDIEEIRDGDCEQAIEIEEVDHASVRGVRTDYSDSRWGAVDGDE